MMHLSSTAKIRIRNTIAGHDASLLYSLNQHPKHKSWTWSISPHLLARQVLHPSRHLKSPADQIPRGQRWPDSVSTPTRPASLVDVVGLGGVLVGGAPVHHLWGLVVRRWWLVFVHGVAEGVFVLEEVAAQVAEVAVLHNHVQLPCWKAQKLQFGEVQKLQFGEVQKLQFGQVQKLQFGGAQKLQFGQVQKLQFGEVQKLVLERYRNFSLERYRNFSLERYRNWVWERYSLDRYRKQELVLKRYRNFSFGEVQTLQLWRGTENPVMERYRNFSSGELQKPQLWRGTKTSALERYTNSRRGTQTLGEVHKLKERYTNSRRGTQTLGEVHKL